MRERERERERDQSAPIFFERLILGLENGEEFSDRTWKEKKMGLNISVWLHKKMWVKGKLKLVNGKAI